MKVHNLMEEYVSQRVESIYDQLSDERNKNNLVACSCSRCRLDSKAYVLNKIKPYYVVSGRGVVYSAQELVNSQLKADVDALILEAIKKVSSTQRPNHAVMSFIDKTTKKLKETPCFNFPIITGTLLNGATFEPLADAEVTLLNSDRTVMMQDSSFANPGKTFVSTNGSYSFWPEAIKADVVGITKDFHFTIEAKAPGFQAVTKGFDIAVTSDAKMHLQFGSDLTVKIPDLILFKI